jgi:hypothetical protein
MYCISTRRDALQLQRLVRVISSADVSGLTEDESTSNSIYFNMVQIPKSRININNETQKLA